MIEAQTKESRTVGSTCNLANLKVEFWNDVRLLLNGGNSPLIGGWIL